MTNLPKSASSSPATKLAEELFDFVVARYKVLTIGNQRDLEVEELAKRIRGSASPSEADEISNIKACNESLAKLIDQVWEALEPTGEYEGDMNLVEFAKSVRIGKESAEWSRDGLLFKAASSSASAVPPPLDEILETLKFAQEVIHDQAERFHKGCRCQMCESLPESLQRAIELLEGSKVTVPQPSAGPMYEALREYMTLLDDGCELENRECDCDSENFHTCETCKEIMGLDYRLRSLRDLWGEKWAIALATIGTR